MNVPRKWIVVGTAAVLGVGGAVTAASLGVNDAPDRDAGAVMLQTEPENMTDRQFKENMEDEELRDDIQ